MSGPASTAESAIPKSKLGEPVWSVAMLFPRQGEWTESDYLALDTNRMIELVDGCLEVLPMPTSSHQRIVLFFYRRLHEFVTGRNLGEVLVAPLPVHLGPNNYREPDILFLSADRARTSRQYTEGAGLVVEVVSEGDEACGRDLRQNPQDYAAAGIPEYWIVDPENCSVTVLELAGLSYRVAGQYDHDATATSRRLPGFSISLGDLFAAAQ
jgi:Uma2 family endonuclease